MTLLFVASASAEQVAIESLDGRITAGEWTGVSESGEIIVVVDGEPTSLPGDTLREIRFARPDTPASRPTAKALIDLADGGQIGFTSLRGAASDAVKIDTPLAADLVVPFKHLAAIRFERLAEDSDAVNAFEGEFAERKPGKDVLISGAGGEVRSVRGTLITLDSDSGQFDFAGTVRAFKPSETFAIVFARGAGVVARPPAEIRLDDGGRLRGQLVASHAQTIGIKTPFGAAVEIPLARIQSIGLSSDRVVMISELSPTTANVEGLLHQPWPVRKDRSVANEPIRLDGRTFARGLGVHARTELVYELDGPFERLLSVIGIDDAVRPLGSVEFKVLGDGRMLYGSGVLNGSDEPRTIDVPVSGVKRLILLVDYGDQLDLSDHADWADARLIRPAVTRRP